ncbi:MAG: hypothetical protein HQK86_05300 [Nitrospinae bacterium]|nr:hypothetical protein [Nitrospinota bacterium]MBF0634156.1 hypothetical protein [Nitrospinota bacterium]
MKYVTHETIWIKNHPELNEKWVQDRIAENPAILGLGDLSLRDRERTQPKGGRLDLLLVDDETLRRYEVEIQLGETDESHIIRTIEYWDIERKRYPQYDHCAVIVAEDITSRFLNVISLFNGSIPLIAIKMSLLKFDDQVSLIFTTVLDEMARGLVDEDEIDQAVLTDRAYWENKSSKEMLQLVDKCFSIIGEFVSGFELKYNKVYIGLSKDGQPNNFVEFRPRRSYMDMRFKLKDSDVTREKLEEAGIEVIPYDKRFGRLRIRLTRENIEKNRITISELMRDAYQNFNV